MTVQVIRIAPIELNWSEWIPWHRIYEDDRGGRGVHIPNKKSGVYEVRLVDHEDRLTIGKASDLRMRIRQGLVKGKTPHSAGKKIRELEDLDQVVVRWTKTDLPSAVEEHLHVAYRNTWGANPKYVDHT